MLPLEIIIVGAGIGGPAAAIGLRRNGHNVTIYERATNTGEVGYAFRITPNSDRCLKHLGIDTVAGGAVSANTVRLLNAEGEIEQEVRENKDPEQAKKATSVFAYRPQLHQQLIDAALDSGVLLRSGVKVVSVDTGKTSVELEDGKIVSADLIIAADGVHSGIRPHIVDSTRDFPSASTGHNAFRFMVSKEDVQKDNVLSSLVNDDFRMVTWAGHDKRFLVYPVDYDRQYNITCTHPASLSDKETSDEDSAAAIAYNQKASFETVLDIYSDFDPRATRLLKMADPDGFRIWKLMDMDEILTWSVNHTVLLGDACHPISPFGFSGASMAIEDAVTLSTLLGIDLPASDLPDRLKLYETIRKPRIAMVRDTSRKIAKDSVNKETMGNYRESLASYDAVKETKKALEEHSKSTA